MTAARPQTSTQNQRKAGRLWLREYAFYVSATSKTAVSSGIIRNRHFEGGPIEFGPIDRDEVKFCVSSLPKKKVCQALIPRRSDD